VVPLAVSFCFFFFVDANSVRWAGALCPRALPGPPEGQVAISSTQVTQQPKLPYRQLSSARTYPHEAAMADRCIIGLEDKNPNPERDEQEAAR
jgi:hypothetical protein